MIVTTSEDTMAANMYRVGDYVYFETSSTSPYQIRRIEELNKTPSGNVEAKVMCFFRRRDLPHPLIMLADKHQLNSTTSSDDTPISSKLKKMLIKAPEGSGSDLSTNLNDNDYPPSNLAHSDAHDPVKRETDEGGGGGVGCGGLTTDGTNAGVTATEDGEGDLSWRQRHQLKHRELFLSRQVETLPATHIRGKCNVTLLNETESYLSYLNKDDTFFYCLVFDPTQKTLLADKGEIRVGVRYQAEPTPLLKEGESDGRNLSDLETLVWTPSHNLTDRQIDQFLVISRSVGTFARALDCSSSVKQPSLHMSAAAASRDVTLFHAMDTLHEHNYVLSEAISRLVPSTGPVLCRDEMEEWSASEANLFEEALEKYGKDFNDIRHDFLPWKTLKNIIEYYYMWKTTDRYVQQKRVKAVEAESKLKQVYIPNYNKPNPAVISSSNSKGAMNGADDSSSGYKTCESCQTTTSSQWYSWGPAHMQYKLCQPCWQYWKKYGGLKSPSSRVPEEGTVAGPTAPENMATTGGHGEATAGVATGLGAPSTGNGGAGRRGGGQRDSGKIGPGGGGIGGTGGGRSASGIVQITGGRPVMKTRTAFYLHAQPLTRVARRLARQILRPRHLARKPFHLVNQTAVRLECQQQMAQRTAAQLKELLAAASNRSGNTSGSGGGGGAGGVNSGGSVTHIADRLGEPDSVPDWLLPTDKSLLPKGGVVMFPKPPKAPDGSLMYERVPNKPEAEKAAQLSNHAMQASLKRRHYDENGLEDADWDDGSRSGSTDQQHLLMLSTNSKRHCKESAVSAAAAAAALSLSQLPSATTAMMTPPPNAAPAPPSHHLHHVNGQGRPKMPPALMTRTGTPRKGVISWMDAPDDVYFRATAASRKMRKQLTSSELRRASRKPWRRITPKFLEHANT